MEGLYTRFGRLGLHGRTCRARAASAAASSPWRPAKLAIAAFSPPLDPAGNSVRGQAAVASVARDLGRNLYPDQPRDVNIESGPRAGASRRRADGRCHLDRERARASARWWARASSRCSDRRRCVAHQDTWIASPSAAIVALLSGIAMDASPPAFRRTAASSSSSATGSVAHAAHRPRHPLPRHARADDRHGSQGVRRVCSAAPARAAARRRARQCLRGCHHIGAGAS